MELQEPDSPSPVVLIVMLRFVQAQVVAVWMVQQKVHGKLDGL
jgi:hypothetical protein